jgi:serine/threonine protein kinase
MRARCPNPACRQTTSFDPGELGRTVTCRHCRQAFVLTAEAEPAATVPVSDIPERIGRFRVLARLGRGAFGSVYRAHDPQLDREVALKAAHPGTLSRPQAMERFLREGKAAARLCHPQIVPVFDAGCDDGAYYLAMTYLEGLTLAAALAEQRPDPRRAAAVVRQLAEALDHAHSLGIVHRDVKPANVMLDGQGDAHLMDFGLAHLQQNEAEKPTHAGAVLGTPAYMAPEQAKGQTGEPLPASDQYSLGAVLYELLCGRPPFDGPAQIVLFHAVQTAPAAPRRLDPHVPLDLETICLKAMAKQPEDHYPSCGDMADDLRRFLEGEPVRARRMRLGERVGV